MRCLVKVNTFFVSGIPPNGAAGPNRAYASPEALHPKGQLAYFLTIGLTRAVTPIEAGRGWLAHPPQTTTVFFLNFAQLLWSGSRFLPHWLFRWGSAKRASSSTDRSLRCPGSPCRCVASDLPH